MFLFRETCHARSPLLHTLVIRGAVCQRINTSKHQFFDVSHQTSQITNTVINSPSCNTPSQSPTQSCINSPTHQHISAVQFINTTLQCFNATNPTARFNTFVSKAQHQHLNINTSNQHLNAIINAPTRQRIDTSTPTPQHDHQHAHVNTSKPQHRHLNAIIKSTLQHRHLNAIISTPARQHIGTSIDTCNHQHTSKSTHRTPQHKHL